jgi:hypothetical protein
MVLLPAQTEKTTIESDSSLYSAVVAIAAVALFSTVGGKNIYVYIYTGIYVYLYSIYFYVYVYMCIWILPYIVQL